jgi:hypothetical protein
LLSASHLSALACAPRWQARTPPLSRGDNVPGSAGAAFNRGRVHELRACIPLATVDLDKLRNTMLGGSKMKRIIWIASAAIIMMASTVSTSAQQGKIVSPAGMDVIIWKRASVQKVLALLHAKDLDVHQFMRLMACEVRSGTAAVVVSQSNIFYNVTVVAGPQTGCRGSVAKKMFVPRQRRRQSG